MMDGYQPQLNPGVTTDYAGAPQDWGGGLTRGLEDAGNSMDRAIHQIKERNRDIEATNAGVQFAQDSAQLDQHAIDLRNQAGPGGAGHNANVGQAINTTAVNSLGNIQDPHIRRIFQERYAQLGDQLSTREYAWASGQAVEHIGTNVDKAGDIHAAAAAASGDPNVLVNAAPALHSMIYSLSGINDDLKGKLYDQQMNKVALSWGDAAARLNPEQLLGDPAKGTKGILDNPEFQSYLHDPKQIDFLRDKAEAELQRRAAMDKAQRSQAVEALHKDADILTYKVENTDYVPHAGEVEGILARAKALDETLTGLKVDVLNDKVNIKQSHQTYTPAQWHSEINPLQQKVSDGKATPAEQMHLKNLQDLSGPSIAKFNQDPVAWAANTSNPQPTIDWTTADPAQLRQMGQARVAWAQPFARSTGMVSDPYLNNDEKKLFGESLKAGPASQIKTIGTLQAAFGTATTAAIMRELEPDNKGLQIMAGLNQRGGELYLKGQQAFHDKTVHLGAQSGTEQEADRAMLSGEDKGSPLNWYSDAIPSEMIGPIKDTAQSIIAGTALEQRNFNPTGNMLSTAYKQAIQRVAGLNGDPNKGENVVGGFANLGKRFGRADGDDNHVWLPGDMGRGEFQHRLVTAGPQDWVKAGGQPYYVGNDGKPAPLSAQQMGMLRTYRFAPAHDPKTGAFVPGNYHLLDQQGHSLMQKDGRTPWQFNIRDLR